MSEPLKPLVIIPEWKSDSSPHGNSYWSTFQNGCPYQRILNKRYADLIVAMELEDDEVTATAIGSAFHKILEHYYRETLDTVAFDSSNAAVAEALRLFGSYRLRFPVQEFGEVIGTEYSFGFDAPQIDPLTGALLGPPTDSPIGVVPFTGRIDMVVNIQDDACIEWLQSPNGRNLPISKKGIYLLDHKTMGQRRQTIEMEFVNSFQFHAYMMCWDALYGATKGYCNGTIANCVVRHKTMNERSFFSVFVPPPTPAQQQAVRAHFQMAKSLRDTYGDDYKNRNACFSWGRVCPHFRSGACDRT